jgi:hypothetical protein
LRIFVSYSRTDASHFAEKIHKDLSKKGYDVFTDVDNINFGDKWSNELEKNISKCDLFVIIVTPAALESEYIEKEVLQAQAANKRIIPCFYEGIMNQNIKWSLKSYQGIDEFYNEYDLALKLYRKIDGSKAKEYSHSIDSKSEVIKDKKNKIQELLKNKVHILYLIIGGSLIISGIFVYYALFYNPIPSTYYGIWANTTNTDSIAKSVIQNINGKTFVQLFGAVTNRLEPWKTVQATYTNNILSGSIILNYKITKFNVSLISDNTLKVETFNHYVDNSNRSDLHTIDLLKKQLNT